MMNGIYCHCNNCPDNEYNNEYNDEVCFLQPGGQCFSAIEETFDEESRSFQLIRNFGCFSADDQALLQCRGNLVPSFYPRSIECCNYTDLCNKYLLPQIEHRQKLLSYEYRFNIFLLVIICIGLVAIISWTYVYINHFKISFTETCFLFRARDNERPRNQFTESCNIKLRKSPNAFSNYISTSGSGSGKPLLIRATIGRQVNRHRCLGRGRFTEVNLAHWNANKIAEKVFFSQYEDLWLTEKNVYETALLRHENILGYISSDVLKSGLKAIYTDYYALGSLHNYLDEKCLNYTDFLNLVKSATAGISYLHTEILGTSKRPAVAHCNITSKNFFVNNNKECVISNFEISVLHISINKELEKKADFTFATPRYMAPEVVNGAMLTSSFEALKMADIYSLGLVFYEICQRCTTVESNLFSVEEHTLPFSDILPKYPTVEDMKKLHAEGTPKDLLHIPTRWENDPNVLRHFLHSILQECLYAHPTSRPSALRVKKNIESVESSYSHQNDVEIL